MKIKMVVLILGVALAASGLTACQPAASGCDDNLAVSMTISKGGGKSKSRSHKRSHHHDHDYDCD